MVNDRPVGDNAPAYTAKDLKNGDRIYCKIIPGANQCTGSEVRSNTITAVIRAIPVLAIYPSDTLVKAGSQLMLKGGVEGNVHSYQWTPENKLNGASTLTPVTIQLTEQTIYKLKVENEFGCSATATAVVRIFRTGMIADAFVPRRGLNDVYRIPSHTALKLKQLHIDVGKQRFFNQ